MASSNMSIHDKLLSSPWIYWSSLAVLWLWLLTTILSFVLTTIAKRITAAISQKETKGVLESASVGMVKLSTLLCNPTPPLFSPYAAIRCFLSPSYDSTIIIILVLTAGSRVLVGKEGHMMNNSPNKSGACDAASPSSLLMWLLEITMPGTPLYPILRGLILVLRTISPIFNAFGVTFSRLKLRITVVDDDDGGKDLFTVNICVNRATIRLVPDKSIPHGLSLVLKVYSPMSTCCSPSSSNGLHLMALNDDALTLDVDATTSSPLTFFIKWSLSVDALDVIEYDAIPASSQKSSREAFIVSDRTSHVLLPKYSSLKIPPLAMIANEEALIPFVEQIQRCSLLRCHDVVSSPTNSKVQGSFCTGVSEEASMVSSILSEVREHAYPPSPSCFTAAASSATKSKQRVKMQKTIMKLVQCMKVEIWLEEVKAKLVTSSKSSEVILNSLVFNANSVYQTTPSCQFSCLCDSMSIRTRGGGDMTVDQDVEEGKERVMLISKALKCTGSTHFASFNEIQTQINGIASSLCIVITNKDVDVALGFIPLYNALSGLHTALKDSGGIAKLITSISSDKSAHNSTTQLEVALALTVSDIDITVLTTRRCGAPPLVDAAAKGGGNTEGSYDFGPAVILFHLPESKLHWSRDYFRTLPLSMTLGTVEGSFQLASRPVVPWFHLASLEVIVRQDPHIPDTAGVVVFPNITLNALSLQLHWTPPAVFVIASLMSSVMKSCVDANIPHFKLKPAFSPLNFPRSGNVNNGTNSQQDNDSGWSLPSLRDADEMAACFACNFSSMGSEYPSGSLVIANIFDVTIYIPQAPLSYEAGYISEDLSLRWLDASLSEPECKLREEYWTCEFVSVEHARIGVPTQPITPVNDGGPSSHPSKASTIEINTSFSEIVVGPADWSTTGGISSCSHMEGWSGKQFVSKPSPYLFVEKFAVRKWHARSNMPACVDMMSKGICGICTPDRLRRIFATSQGITLAVWTTMLMLRRSRIQSTTDIEAFDKNLPWDSEIAFQYWLNHWQSVIAEGYDAPSGDTLIRLNFCDVDVTANFPVLITESGEMLDAITANVRAGTFGSDSAPEHLVFEGVSLSLMEGECKKRHATSTHHNHELVGLSRFSIKSTLQSFVSSENIQSYFKSPISPQILISDAFYEIRARANACGIDIVHDLPRNLSTLIFEPMGFLIEARGVKISLENERFIAKSIEQLMSHAFHAFNSIQASGGRWHPAAGGPSGDFHHLFWKPPLPREHYDSTDGLSPGIIIWGERVWLRLYDVLFTIGDDPMEGWLDALAPVWLSHLADQEVITRLRDWPNGGGTVPLLMERKAEQAYICEARKALAMSHQRLVEIELSNLYVDVSPPHNGNRMCAPMLRKLGRDFSTSTCTSLTKTSLELGLKGISICIRRADKPLMSLPHLNVNGDILLVTKDLQKRVHGTPPSSMELLIKGGFLLDIKCNVGDMSFNYCPAALAGIEELALMMHTLCPPYIMELMGKDVAWWDMCRGFIDGHIEVLARNTSIYLSKSHRTASASCHRTATHCLSCGSCKRAPLQSIQEEETILVKVSMACVIIPPEGPHVTLEAAGLSLELLDLHDIYPDMAEPPCLIYTPPFLVAPIVKATIGMNWAVDDKIYHPLHSSGVVFHLSADILGLKDYPSEGPLNEFLFESGIDVSPLAQSLPSQLEVNFFGVKLASFWCWLSCFVLEGSPPLPPKCIVEYGGPGILSFARHIRGLHLEHFGVSKADIALLHTDPGDPFRRGIRFSLRSGFTFAVVLAMEKLRGKCGDCVIPDPFETGRLAIPSPSKQVWTFSGLQVHAKDEGIEIRLVSHEAGPHGALLFSSKGLHVSQSSGLSESTREAVDPTTERDADDIARTRNFSSMLHSVHKNKSGVQHKSMDRLSQSSGAGIIPDMSLLTSVYLSRQRDTRRIQKGKDDGDNEGSLSNDEFDTNSNSSRYLWDNDDVPSSSTSRSTSTNSEVIPIPTSHLKKDSGALSSESTKSRECRRGRSKACQVLFSSLLEDEQRVNKSNSTEIEEKLLDTDHCETGPKLEDNKPRSTYSSGTTTIASDNASLSSNPALVSSSSAANFESQAMGSEFLFEVTVKQPRVLLSPFICDSLATLAQDVLELVTSAIPMSAAPPAELLKRNHPNERQYDKNGHSFHSPCWGIDMPPSSSRFEDSLHSSEEALQRMSTGDIAGLVPEIIYKLFSIEAVALQVQLRDEEKSRSCAVFGVGSAVIQGWVGLKSGVRAGEDECSASPLALQYLAQRLLRSFQEAVTLTLKDTRLFVAPTDIDVAAGVMWLPCDVFSLFGNKPPCEPVNKFDSSRDSDRISNGSILSKLWSGIPSDDNAPFSSSVCGLGIFRPVLQAIPLITLQVLAQHGYPENHIINLSVPPVLFEMDGKQQEWLFSVVSSVLHRGLPPDLMKQWKQNAKRRRGVVSIKKEMETHQQQQQGNDIGNMGATFSSLSYVPSADDVSETVHVAQAWLDLRRLRWDLRLLLRLKEELEKVQRCTQGTRPPRVVVVTLEAWADHANKLIQHLEVMTAEAVIWLRYLVKESIKLIAQKPFTQIIVDFKGLEIRLLQEESAEEAFFMVVVSSIVVNMSVYDDESGRVDIRIKSCTAHWLDSRKQHLGGNRGDGVVPFHSPRTAPKVHKGGLFVSDIGTFRNMDDPINSSGRFSAPNFITVLAPVTTMDLPNIPSGVLRRWTEKDDAIHVQAILAAPSSDRIPVFWHMEISVVPLLVHLHRRLFDNFEQYGDACASASHAATLSYSCKAKGQFLMPSSRIKSKHGGKRDRGLSISAKPTHRVAQPGYGNIAEDRGYDSDEEYPKIMRSPSHSSMSVSGPYHHSHHGEIAGIPIPLQNNDAPGVPFFKRHFILQHGRIGELNIFVSYTDGSSVAPESALETLDNFHLKLHPKTYINKTWSLQRAQTRIKRDAILDILKQVQRNFDNFGRFLARRMGIKLKPSSKMTTDLANRAENSGAASNIRGGKAALVDDMEVHISKHGQATGQSGELPGPDSAMKLAHDRDTPANRTLIFSPGEHTQLHLEDIPECNDGPGGDPKEAGVSMTSTDSPRPKISRTDEGNQWPFKAHINQATGRTEATEAATFLKPEKKSKGRLGSKIKLNLRRRFSTHG